MSAAVVDYAVVAGMAGRVAVALRLTGHDPSPPGRTRACYTRTSLTVDARYVLAALGTRLVIPVRFSLTGIRRVRQAAKTTAAWLGHRRVVRRWRIGVAVALDAGVTRVFAALQLVVPDQLAVVPALVGQRTVAERIVEVAGDTRVEERAALARLVVTVRPMRT